MNTDKKISYKKIIEYQDKLIRDFHSKKILFNEENALFKNIYNNMLSNYKLWHLEDEARRLDVGDAVIADIKRKIDRENQSRNDYIEKIDETLLTMLPSSVTPDLPINSETPGAVIDRLSIGGLKIYHMAEETDRKNAAPEHIKKCSEKLQRLKLQRQDLGAALGVLLEELFNGKKQLRVYRQFKMYNDPKLNPALYGKN